MLEDANIALTARNQPAAAFWQEKKKKKLQFDVPSA
jgi:hypothetical protein